MEVNVNLHEHFTRDTGDTEQNLTEVLLSGFLVEELRYFRDCHFDEDDDVQKDVRNFGDRNVLSSGHTRWRWRVPTCLDLYQSGFDDHENRFELNQNARSDHILILTLPAVMLNFFDMRSDSVSTFGNNGMDLDGQAEHSV